MSEDGQEMGRLQAIGKIPKEQRFCFKISPAPGLLLNAATVGDSLSAMSKLIKSIGTDLGQKLIVSLLDIKFDDDDGVEFHLLGSPLEGNKNRTPKPTPSGKTPTPPNESNA